MCIRGFFINICYFISYNFLIKCDIRFSPNILQIQSAYISLINTRNSLCYLQVLQWIVIYTPFIYNWKRQNPHKSEMFNVCLFLQSQNRLSIFFVTGRVYRKFLTFLSQKCCLISYKRIVGVWITTIRGKSASHKHVTKLHNAQEVVTSWNTAENNIKVYICGSLKQC